MHSLVLTSNELGNKTAACLHLKGVKQHHSFHMVRLKSTFKCFFSVSDVLYFATCTRVATNSEVVSLWKLLSGETTLRVLSDQQ